MLTTRMSTQVPCVYAWPADFSPTGLRVLREVAQAGSFSAAAHSLGYTQSAVSRQVAALEAVAGRRLFDRGRARRRPDAGGRAPAAARDPGPGRARRRAARGGRRAARGRAGPPRRVRDGGGGAGPQALAALPRGADGHPARGHHAGADARAAGRHARPRDPRPHAAVPAARRRVAAARAHDAVRARAGHRRARAPPVRRRRRSRSSQLAGQVWVASRSDTGDSLLGVWPGLAERPDVRYVVRDWLAKLQIVAAGLAITTLAPVVRRRAARRRRGRRRARRATRDAARRAGAPARAARRPRPRGSPTR